MIGLNQVQLMGYVGDEPKSIQTKTNTSMCSLTLATTEKGFTKRDGTKVEDRTEWHNVTAFGKLAEIIIRYVHKGAAVFIQGKLRSRTYQDKNGVNHRITEVSADTLQLFDKKEIGGQNQNKAANTQSIPAPSESSTDDLPF